MIRKELGRILAISSPLTVGYVSGTVMLATDLSFVGHLDTESLAGMSLASTVINGSLVFTGGIIDTLRLFAAQAIGAADTEEVGLGQLCPSFCRRHRLRTRRSGDQEILLDEAAEGDGNDGDDKGDSFEHGNIVEDSRSDGNVRRSAGERLADSEADTSAHDNLVHRKRMELVGIWTQTAIFLVFLMSLVISVLWIFTGDIVCGVGGPGVVEAELAQDDWDLSHNATTLPLTLATAATAASTTFMSSASSSMPWTVSGSRQASAGPPPANTSTEQVCSLANVYGRWSVLWLWPLAGINVGRTLLEAMEITLPQTVLSAVFSAANFGVDELFINVLGLGYVGSPVATAVSTMVQFAVYWALFVRLLRLHRPYWPGWTRRAITRRRLKKYLRIGVPIVCTAVLYEWVWDIQILMSGALGAVSAAAFNVTVNLMFTLNSVFLGLSVALSIRVATELGAGDVRAAQLAVRVATALACALTVTVAATAGLLHRQLGLIYSDDAEVLALTDSLVPLMAAYFTLTTASLFMQAVLEGMGRPQVVTGATFAGGWLVGLPLSWLFAWPAGMGLQGLWLGALIGELCKCLVAGAVLLRNDWPASVRRVKALAAQEEEEEQQFHSDEMETQ